MIVSKKAGMELAGNTLINIIVIAISVLVTTVVLASLVTQTDEASLVLACRTSILQRAALNDVAGAAFGELACRTIEKDVGFEEEGDKELVMKTFSEHAVKCWNMMGEGVLNGMSDIDDRLDFKLMVTSLFGVGKKLCFICYDLETRQLDGDISYGDFLEYFQSNVYLAESNTIRWDCLNVEKDSDEYLEMGCADINLEGYDKNRLARNPCELNGGTCKETCDTVLEVPYTSPEWYCSADNNVERKCCIPRTHAYTYNKYIENHGGKGGQLLVNPDGETMFTEDEHYGIAFVMPFQDAAKVSFIGIAKYADLAPYCTHSGVK